jgi:hypothetical protein
MNLKALRAVDSFAVGKEIIVLVETGENGATFSISFWSVNMC